MRYIDSEILEYYAERALYVYYGEGRDIRSPLDIIDFTERVTKWRVTYGTITADTVISHNAPNTLIVNIGLKENGLTGRMNYAIAKETARILLQRLVDAESERAADWQSKRMAAALLMPCPLIEWVSYAFLSGKPIRRYGDRLLANSQRTQIYSAAQYLGVSVTAFLYRMEQLGYMERLPEEEYYLVEFLIRPLHRNRLDTKEMKMEEFI